MSFISNIISIMFINFKIIEYLEDGAHSSKFESFKEMDKDDEEAMIQFKKYLIMDNEDDASFSDKYNLYHNIRTSRSSHHFQAVQKVF